jgi:hypothetical protein
MIVLSSALIISPSAGVSLHLPIIGWQNLVTTSNLVADFEDADFPAVRLANPNTNELWVSSSTADQYVTITLSGTDEVDYFAIARHNFGSDAVVVSVEADTGSGYAEVGPETLPGDDSPILWRFTEINPTAIRLKLQPGSVAPQAAVIHVGKLLQMEWGVQAGHTPINYGRERDIVAGRSEAGDYLGRIQSGGRLITQANIKNLSDDFYRDEVDPFIEDGGPFFWAWDPQDHPAEVGYVWFTNEPKPVPSIAGHIEISMDLEGIGL